MSSGLILLDDAAFSPGFSPSSVWGSSHGQLWYHNYSSWAKNTDASTSTYGSFSVTFEGISIAFTGNTPGTSNKQDFSVSVDGAEAYVASYPSPAEYLQWYMSPTLEEGNHTITLSELDNIDVDYAIVAVGNQTTVQGKDILVDDTSNAIVWTGGWQTNTSTLAHITRVFVDNHPLGNSTKDSSTAGDSFSFQFTGTNVSVFGAQRLSIIGGISADFSVDGEKTTTFSTTSNASGNDIANTMFFSSPVLASGAHTLFMNITEVAGDQSFMLDYITYSDQVSDGKSSSSPTSSSGSWSTNPPSSSGTTSPYSPPKTTQFAGIVGGAVGGSVALLLIIGALIWWRRSKRTYHKANLISLSVDQFVLCQAELSAPTPSTREKNLVRLQTGGTSVVGSSSTRTVGLPPMSPSSSRPQAATENQVEIRRRLDEINRLIAQMEQPSNETAQIQELQTQIEMLTEENTRLMGVPPPAYQD
ncbi:hypothetical protein ARMSODRAFT_1021068 [Armillaria solidipes]|uniref:Uncharacterized protein n=1 Tax=Armillaria solidipes TaxID=1076256 RepID=A0A2H3BM61_9AGAR|nr:hypothetical protein ARMSODRAFT_1021068 [Armillaria solidipes]